MSTADAQTRCRLRRGRSETMLVGYCFDPIFLKHEAPGHPERPERLRAVMAGLAEEGLLGLLRPIPPAPEPDRDILIAVHDEQYLQWLARLEPESPCFLDADNYICRHSGAAAYTAVGAAIACVEAVVLGEVTCALALVRPPGHHALRRRPYGFCLLNNVACGAEYALRRLSLSRIGIVDIDAHHGNGTQAQFYSTDAVLYISTHQAKLFPGTGAVMERGEGIGTGYTVNIPVPAGSGDAVLQAAFARVTVPALEHYRPELILVSAGYDAHWRDPLSALTATLRGFDSLHETLVELAGSLCEGRLVFVLEGGYDTDVLRHAICNLVWLLLGQRERCADPVGSAPRREADDPSCLDLICRELGF